MEESTIKSMFKNAMKEKWEDVMIVYKDNPTAQKAPITRSGDTALHVAIYSGRTDTARKLVDLIAHQDLDRILGIKNDGGNNALHLAATLGMVEICLYMAGKVPELITSRNSDGETPLFLAVYHGERKTFMTLHSKCQNGKDISLCRRADGNTILHCAIMGEYFDLAFNIIRKYPSLVNSHNEKGQSALHLMASHPSLFRSGRPLGTFDSIIYKCTPIDPFDEETVFNDADLLDSDRKSKCPLPENYTACWDVITLFWKLGPTLFGRCKRASKDAKATEGTESVHGRDIEQPGHDTHHPDPQPSGVGGGEQHIFIERVDQGEGHALVQSIGGSEGHVSIERVGVENRTTPPRPSLKPVQVLPPNYDTCFYMFKLAMKVLLVLLGLGYRRINKIKDKKQKHTWASQIMEELVSRASSWEYDNNGRKPQFNAQEQPTDIDIPHTKPKIDDVPSRISQSGPKNAAKEEEGGTRDTPILLAAKMGVTEVVEKILEFFPVAIQDMNDEKKNIVLLAVENKQPQVYQFLLKRKLLQETVFKKVDHKGNGALHLAATLGKNQPKLIPSAALRQNRPWLIPGAALQMQWEIKWYKFIKNSMPRHFFAHHNNNGQTPKEIFTETHEDLVVKGGAWLTNTSQSCSVVAALIATVAFATAATVPGGVKQESGSPTLEGKLAFKVFAISSLIALCLSITSLVMFLAILTSRYQEKDFERDLPMKMIRGLTSLFLSIISMLVSFCAGHFFVLEDKIKYAAYPVYIITCLPVTFFALAQFPLYVDLLRSIFTHVPQRTHKIISF